MALRVNLLDHEYRVFVSHQAVFRGDALAEVGRKGEHVSVGDPIVESKRSMAEPLRY